MTPEYATHKMIWKNIIFFSVTTLIALIGTPLYLLRHGITPADILLFTFYMMATGLSITAGYHRLFSHASYKAHPVVEFFFLFFGAAAFEQSAFFWSSQHRDHHRFVDTDQDPYSIKKGFWYAHIGWLLFWLHPEHFENAKDLSQNRMVMHQHRYYVGWAVGAGILLPLLLGAATGSLWGALVLAVCLRLTLVYHSTFFINSICHMFGKATYDIESTAKDHWLVAFLTYGEGYHNFHHRFPSDYRNAVRWYQWDPSKWLIYALSRLGLCSRLKRISDFRILEARLAAESQQVRKTLLDFMTFPEAARALERFQEQYQHLRNGLAGWDQAFREYHEIGKNHLSVYSRDLEKAASYKLQDARRYFEKIHADWVRLLELQPARLCQVLEGAS